MTVELYGEAPEDIEDLVLAWLLPLAGSPTKLGAERPDVDGGELPYRLVTGLHIVPDDNLFYVEALVSVHTFDKTRTLAKRAAKDTQRRMDVLTDNPLTDIVMAGGRIANVEFCECPERYHYEPYGVDTVKRYVSRFNIGLSFVAVS
jgi:hypothetical protein